MKALLRSTLLLAIVLSMNSPSAFSMIKSGAAGEEKPTTKEQGSSLQQQATRRERGDEGRALYSEANTKRGNDVAAGDETGGKAIEGEESLNDMEKSWPIKMPSSFSETEREWLQRDLQKISPEKLYQYNRASWNPNKQTQQILNLWMTKGVTIDPDFVAEATAIREDAKTKTAAAKKLETRAGQVSEMLEEKQHYAAALHYSDQFIEAATQARDAWVKTSEMHQQIPGRQWGLQLKDIWAQDVHLWEQRREKMHQKFREEIEKVSREAAIQIKKFQDRCDIFKAKKNYNEMARLSDAYGKIIIAQRALPSPLPEESLSMAAAIKLELGLESLKVAMLQAELKYQTIIGIKGAESDLEERTTNESITTSSASLQGKLSADEIEAEKRNHAFQQRATALESYAANTLETVYDCFAYFTSGGEFADETDTNDLAAAYDRVETTAWVLNALQTRTANGEHDSWLQQEKQKIAISDLEQAIEEAHTIATRVGNEEVYEKDSNTDKILADLQKNKTAYETALQNGK